MKTATDLLFLAIVLLLYMLFFTGSRKVFGKSKGLLVTAVLTLLLAAQALLAAKGFFRDFSGMPPRIFLLIGPVFFLLFIIAFLPRTSRWVAPLSQTALSGFQSFRIAVEIVLWALYAQVLIPVQMTFEGRNFDIVSGILGAVVGLLLWRKVKLSRAVILVWNFIGLGLLINIVVTAILSTPVSFRFFMNEPANTIVAELPYVWLPGFVVPMAFLLHILSIRKALQ